MEQKVSLASAEVDAYKKRCELLQKQNASLMTQLNNLRALLVNQSSSSSSGSTASLIGGVTSSTTATASNFISTSTSINGIVKTEPTTIPTNSIKIEPDCKFTKILSQYASLFKVLIVLIYHCIYYLRFFFQAWMPFCLLGWI